MKNLNNTIGIGNIDVVDLLTETGAAINIANKDGYTPLINAIAYGKLGICIKKQLRKLGGNENQISKLMFSGHEKIVHMLVERGANVNAAIEDGQTALYFAANNGKNKISFNIHQ